MFKNSKNFRSSQIHHSCVHFCVFSGCVNACEETGDKSDLMTFLPCYIYGFKGCTHNELLQYLPLLTKKHNDVQDLGQKLTMIDKLIAARGVIFEVPTYIASISPYL